jgi:hypothetical protein
LFPLLKQLFWSLCRIKLINKGPKPPRCTPDFYYICKYTVNCYYFCNILKKPFFSFLFFATDFWQKSFLTSSKAVKPPSAASAATIQSCAMQCISFTYAGYLATRNSATLLHNFALAPLQTLWTPAAAQAAPLAAAGMLARGQEEAFCSGLSQGAQALSQSRLLHFAWHLCGRRGAGLLMFNTHTSTPAGRLHSFPGPPFSRFCRRRSAASPSPAVAGASFAHLFVLPAAHVRRSALDASRGGSNAAIQTHGATAGAAVGTAAAASPRLLLHDMSMSSQVFWPPFVPAASA